jgi:hypothetical protein
VSDHYSGHDPAYGCGLMLLIAGAGAVVAFIGFALFIALT